MFDSIFNEVCVFLNTSEMFHVNADNFFDPGGECDFIMYFIFVALKFHLCVHVGIKVVS